ncbi:MAG: hypothetical protein JW862_09865 [Anaerolineales bacterium]|nr:hypothetical protein [Anaerolineales bacterium]
MSALLFAGCGTQVPTPVLDPGNPTTLVVVSPPSPGMSLLELDCLVGTGLRVETSEYLLAQKDHATLIMSPTSQLAEQVFPSLPGWLRVLGAPSLSALESKAQRAQAWNLPYEALAYGLETSRSTPDIEWKDLLASTQAAREIADRYGKLLMLAPGFRLMSENEELYPEMAALADIWLFQTQRLQLIPSESEYRQEVQHYVDLIRSGNPDIVIFAQITIPPDQELQSAYWFFYYDAIVDLVDGTYLGIYTWDVYETDQLTQLMRSIYARACGWED